MKTRGRQAVGLLSAWLIAMGAASGAAMAQDSAPPDDVAEEKVGEEITVTAMKGGAVPLQELPISISAPSEMTLRARGVEDIEGIAAAVPGFTVQNLGPGQSQVAVRHVSSGQIVRDQPGVKEQVGVYLDESGISMSLFTPDIDLFDLARVELLKGPQGTLFGAGSESGTLRYITNQPQVGLADSVAEFSLNSVADGEIGGSAKAAVNVPLGDAAAMRVTAYYTQLAGYIDAVQPGLGVEEDVNSGSRTGVRWAFRFEPSDRLTVTPRVMYQEVDTDGWNRADVFNILGNPFTTTRPKVTLGDREQFTQFEEPFTDEFLLADLNLEYRFGDVALTSVTSYTDRDVLVVRDATALTASITGGSIGLPPSSYEIDAPLDDATTASVMTQELRFSSGDDRVRWVAGGFYSTMEREYGQSLLVSGFEAASGIPTRGLRAPKDVLFYSDLDYDLDQFALFGEVTYSVNERLDLTGGLRYYDFQEDRTQVFDGIFGNDNNGTSLVATAGSTSADGFAPRLIASYAVSDSTRLNAQVAKGFRLGGINDPLNVPLCTADDLRTFGGRDNWKDETLWNYEIGTKSSVMGNRGTFNVSAFYMDIQDLQATVTAGSCSSRLIFNVPKARTTGLELEFAAAPNPNFDFAISASYGEGEVRSTLTSTAANGTVSVVSGIEKGARLPSVPEFQASASATYQRAWRGDWLWYLTGSYQHIGSRYTQIEDQTPGYGTVDMLTFAGIIGGPLTQRFFNFDPELPAYDLVNLRWGFVNAKWDIALFVNNVTDEKALLSLDRERGKRARVSYLVNQPRTIGVSMRIDLR